MLKSRLLQPKGKREARKNYQHLGAFF
jgi:hypothetical protein